jgi:hypothetical protein
MHAVVEFTHNRLLADVELVRASVRERFIEAITHGEVDVTHFVAHGSVFESALARLDGLAGQDP